MLNNRVSVIIGLHAPPVSRVARIGEIIERDGIIRAIRVGSAVRVYAYSYFEKKCRP